LSENVGVATPSGCTQVKADQRSTTDQVAWLGAEPTELFGVAENREICRVLPGTQPPQPSLEEGDF